MFLSIYHVIANISSCNACVFVHGHDVSLSYLDSDGNTDGSWLMVFLFVSFFCYDLSLSHQVMAYYFMWWRLMVCHCCVMVWHGVSLLFHRMSWCVTAVWWYVIMCHCSLMVCHGVSLLLMVCHGMSWCVIVVSISWYVMVCHCSFMVSC